MSDELAEVAAALYALPPEEFTAARDRAAKDAAGDVRKAVKALRRPTASAALVNRLSREQPDLLEQLLALGPALAEAQAGRSGDELRALGRQRRELVQAVTSSASPGATTAVRTEVEQTLEAALADPAAADAVRSGTLVRPLAFAGFGGVDVEGAVAVARPAAGAARMSAAPGSGTPASGKPASGTTTSRPSKGTTQRTARAEQAALDAAAELDDAVRAAETAARRLEAAEQAQRQAEAGRAEAQGAVDQLERQLTEAREQLATAGHAAHDAARAQEAAAQAAQRAHSRVGSAQDAAERARAALDALRRGGDGGS